MKVKHFSDNSLLALHLALRAARRGATQVVVLNIALQRHLGKQRVHKARIHKFAATLAPIFPRHSIGKEDKLKNCLFLYLNEKPDQPSQPKTKIIREFVHTIPNQAVVDQSLPIKLIESGS
jgi:hypothetical protein